MLFRDLRARCQRFAELSGLTPMQVIQRLGHAFCGQRLNISRLRVPQKLGDIARRDGVIGQLTFEPAQTERYQYQ